MDFSSYTIIDLFRNIRHIHIGLYFSNFISNENYDYMYTHWKTGTTISAVIHELTGMKYSVCLHANELYPEKWIADWRFVNAEEIVVNNTYNKHYFNLITDYRYKNRIRIIRNIPPKIDRIIKHRKAVRTPLNLLSLGRLIHFKDHPTLLNACKIMSNNGLDFRLVIGGGGDCYKLIESLAKDLKIESNIKMIGKYNEDDLWDLFENADLFIHASGIGPGGTRDGLPNVIIEAMMACVPVISTYISSIPENRHTSSGNIFAIAQKAVQGADQSKFQLQITSSYLGIRKTSPKSDWTSLCSSSSVPQNINVGMKSVFFA